MGVGPHPLISLGVGRIWVNQSVREQAAQVQVLLGTGGENRQQKCFFLFVLFLIKHSGNSACTWGCSSNLASCLWIQWKASIGDLISYYYQPPKLCKFLINAHSNDTLREAFHKNHWIRGWREPGNSIKYPGMARTGRGVIVLLLYENTWPGRASAWQRQSGTGAGREFLVLFGYG